MVLVCAKNGTMATDGIKSRHWNQTKAKESKAEVDLYQHRLL